MLEWITKSSAKWADTGEKKLAVLLEGNFNFIKNLRKNISSESEIFEDILLTNAMYVALVFIAFDILLPFVGYKSILGLAPKLLALAIILAVKFKRRKH